ncbi:glycoside hydrolase family 3 N-terminal domain-containing protein [Cellulomonas dongxiuzhuiae]|uniref:beta-glucosidase n=1 Tax=Cellulomonas dongxiuzhuiae TaxID=2819979 RepID=A0ABX8GJJ8_9CELL|nr:glycoside hydrolase family 3 N-terminal domain-containing protein [Cellulomonas dongxiuzhuiae]MBO3095002.1 glycoside hydrolase family 3 C-terminal domain-containing protein [Cellulomonas dongxiuzhuiae]QWC16018.1 glycoside hydrolase family 3 C-terminal domain-containing protein [Cellulomonas dongxiuzhuiae]
MSVPTSARRLVAGLCTGALLVPLVVIGGPAAQAAAPVTVAPSSPLVTAAEGDVATVALTATTGDGAALAAPVTVFWSTGTGTASGGADYTETGGVVTFPAGATSGSTQEVAVEIAADDAAETTETVPLTFSTTTADATVTGGATVAVLANGFPYLDATLPVDERVDDLLGRMTLAEKAGQMTQAERANVAGSPGRVASLGLGSVLSGGGSTPTPNTPAGWADMVDGFQTQSLSTRLSIPLLYGVDAVHGHNNLVGATVFPHNIGLGAMRDPGLVERAAHITAAETRTTGPQWSFAPCICVARDLRWGRTYESFGEDPALVVLNETAIDGLQGPARSEVDRPDRVLASVKHFAGDGDTTFGTGSGDYTIDQGVTITSREDFERIDLAPYVPAVRDHRAGTVMPSFSSVDWTEDGTGNPVKMHAQTELVTGWLKGEQEFDGFVISDWEAIKQLPGDYAAQVRASVNAGVDMFMEPNSPDPFVATLMGEVRAGRVPVARVDDAVRRILRQKVELGLFEHPYTDRAGQGSIGSAEHRAVAREAVVKSQVLLRNSGGALPLAKDARIYLAGRAADNIGIQAGGWTVTWQGQPVKDLIPGTTIRAGIGQVAPDAQVTFSEDASAPTDGSDVGVVVVGETPYAEGFGDVDGPGWPWDPSDGGVPREPGKQLTLTPADQAVVDTVCGAIDTCVVLVVAGRPNVVADPDGQVDALVASWLPGSEGAGVADVLFGDAPFTGRLGMTWPRTPEQEPINVGDADYDPELPFGWGLRTDSARERLTDLARELASSRDRDVRRALAEIATAVQQGGWTGSGGAADERTVLRALGRAVDRLAGGDGLTWQQMDTLISVLRDAAQQRVVEAGDDAPPGWAADLADAEHALLVGEYARAAHLLLGVAGHR